MSAPTRTGARAPAPARAISGAPARRALRRLVPAVLLAAALIGLWQLVADFAVRDPQVLPSPAQVAAAGWQQRTALWQNTVPTLQETAAGFGLSFAVSWIVAGLMDFCGPARRAVYPLLVASQTVPIIVVAPLSVVVFGFGLLPKALLVTLATFFPLTVALAEGFAAGDGEADRLLRSMGARRWQSFVKVRVPGAIPYFFTGLRVGITYAIGGAVFAEYAGTYRGLGIYMEQMQSAFRTDLVFATVIVIALFSTLLFLATYPLERLIAPWLAVQRRDGAR